MKFRKSQECIYVKFLEGPKWIETLPLKCSFYHVDTVIKRVFDNAYVTTHVAAVFYSGHIV